MVSPAGGGTDAGNSQRLPRLAGLFALRAALVLIAVAAASLTLFRTTTSVKAEQPDCPGGTLPFVANFAVPAGTFDPNLVPGVDLPPNFSIEIVEGPPSSNVDLITVSACIPQSPGAVPPHSGPPGGRWSVRSSPRRRPSAARRPQ